MGMADELAGIGTEHLDPHQAPDWYDESSQHWYTQSYAGSHDHAEYERARVQDMHAACEAIADSTSYNPAGAVRAVGDLLTAASMVLGMGGGDLGSDAVAEAQEWFGLTGEHESTDAEGPFWQQISALRNQAQEVIAEWQRNQAVETNYFIFHMNPYAANVIVQAARDCRANMHP
jgi:hypothetical protein